MTALFIYKKEDQVFVYDSEDLVNGKHDELIKSGHKHIHTLECKIWLRYLLKQNDKEILTEIKSLKL